MIMIQGIADCAFLEDGKLVVVDYKTDRTKTPRKACSPSKMTGNRVA